MVCFLDQPLEAHQGKQLQMHEKRAIRQISLREYDAEGVQRCPSLAPQVVEVQKTILISILLSVSVSAMSEYERAMISFEFGLRDGLLIPGPAIIVLDIESAHILEADLHALLLGGREQLVFEGIDASVEALGVEVETQFLVLHLIIIILIEAQIRQN
jgi:hypothetical protein